jgi:DNA-binding transcriptional ArsR family regulator
LQEEKRSEFVRDYFGQDDSSGLKQVSHFDSSWPPDRLDFGGLERGIELTGILAIRALTKRFVNATLLVMVDLRVIEDPASASVALDPVRSRLLSELRTPMSAATLAGRLGLPRQKVNYHLRTLEAHGLVRVDSKKRWGGLTERRLVATASSYVVSPGALGLVAADPARGMDRLSASYLVALAARVVREVGQLLRKSEELNKRLATLSIDTEVRFRSAEDRAAFSSELNAAVAALVSRYHDESAPGGRRHRLIIGAYPTPGEPNRRVAVATGKATT